jgi:exosortase
MKMTGESAAEAPSARPLGTKRDILAWASAIIACIVLLGFIRYCPSYGEGKATMFEMWVGTFWNDVVTQITSIFAATSKETLSGETVASEWNYCLMVPFIVAWLVWRLWPQLRAMPAEGQPVAGYAILALGFFVYVAGFLMENYYIGMGSMEFIYAGLIVLYLGWPIMRLLFFPWVFLMFMWPYNFMEDVAADLRRLMSNMSHHVLELIGVQNVLMGTAILSPQGSAHPFAIDIADPCSGIRSLFALVMIAAVFAFISFEKLWQQAIIIALAVPMVIFGNLIRIVILTLATIHFGEGFALGTNTQPSWFHEGAGYLVYIINFGGLILIGTYLAKLTTPPQPPQDDART